MQRIAHVQFVNKKAFPLNSLLRVKMNKAVEAQEVFGLEVLRGGDASQWPRLCRCVSDA